jgi:AraC family transcriptional regulator
MSEFAPITLGRALRVVQSESFTFTETAHAGGAVLAPHAHENAAISYVVSGRRTYTFGSDTLDCAAGTIVFVPAGATHASRFFSAPALGIMIELRREHHGANVLREPARTIAPDLAIVCERVRREMADPDDLAPLALESLGLELLVRHARSGARDVPRWIVRVRDALHDSFRNPLPLSVLAAGASVERSRLTREFRRHFGMSIGAYVRDLRARRAWQLVTTTQAPLCEVAADCGFADQSHLTRAFRRAFATSPGQLRTRRRTSKSAPSVQDTADTDA